MAHTYEELHGMTVAELKEIAKDIEHDALHGYTTMHKDHLVPALCQALGIEAHVHHEVVGIDKTAIKAKMRELKLQRDAAVAAHDHKQLKVIRRRIHHVKRKMHKATI
ncbi:MAG: hypothetical protein WBH85_09145 [Thermoanaerobaculia bacterium]